MKKKVFLWAISALHLSFLVAILAMSLVLYKYSSFWTWDKIVAILLAVSLCLFIALGTLMGAWQCDIKEIIADYYQWEIGYRVLIFTLLIIMAMLYTFSRAPWGLSDAVVFWGTFGAWCYVVHKDGSWSSLFYNTRRAIGRLTRRPSSRRFPSREPAYRIK